MAKKVYIDVIVDDKGTTKKVAVDAQKLGANLDKTSKSARSADRSLKGAAQASSNGTKNFSKMAQGITGGLVPAYAAFAAQIFALSAAFNFLKNAADLENLRKSQESFAASSGLAIRSTTEALKEASQGMLGFQEAAQASAIGAAKGFSTTQLVQLTEGAGKAAAALGRNYQDSFDRLLRGVSKAEPELLDELGITLKLEEATQRYGDAIGKTRDELTTSERSQAVFLETMRQLNDTFGDQAVQANPFIQLSKTFEEIEQKITEKVLPVIIKLVDLINNNAQAALTAFAAVAALILLNIQGVGSAIGGVISGIAGKTGKAIGGLASIAGKGLGKLTSGMGEKLTEGFKNVLDEIEFAEALLEEKAAAVGKKAQSSAKSAVEGGAKSKTLQKLATTGTATPQALGKLEKDLERVQKEIEETGKTASKAFAGMSLDAVKKLRKEVKELGKTTLSTGDKAKKVFAKTMVGALKLARKTAEGTAKGFKLMARAAKNAGGKMDKAFGFLKKVGVITTVVLGVIKAFDELAKSPVKAIDAFKSFVSSTAKMLQRMLNVILIGLNKLLDNSVIRKLFGVKEGEKLISDFTFADDIDEKLNQLEGRVLEFAGTTREELQKIDDATARQEAAEEALENHRAKVEDLRSSYQTLREDIDSITKGVEAQEDPVRKVQQITKGLVTLPLQGALEKAAEHGDFKKAFDEIIASADFSVFPEELQEALRNHDVKKVQQLTVAAGAYQSALTEIKNVSASLAKDIRSGDPLAALVLIERLQDVAEGGDKAAEAFGPDGGLQDLLSQLAGEDVPKLIRELKALDMEMRRISQQKHLLKMDEIRDQRLPGIVRSRNQRGRAADRAALALREAEAKLRQFQATAPNISDKEKEAYNRQVTEQLRNIRQLSAAAEEAKFAASDMGQMVIKASDALASSMSQAFEGIIRGTMTVKEAFRSMALSIVDSMIKILAQQFAAQILGSMFANFSPQATKMNISNTQAVSASLGPKVTALGTPSGRTGVIAEPVPGYSTGGIARGRQAGYPAILHGTEAVVPLPNGKEIPVQMRNGGENNNVVVNVNMDGSGSREDSEGDDQRMRDMGRAISQAVQEELQKQKRPGGILSPYGAA